MTIIEDLQKAEPDRNPLFTAISTLTTKEEIRQFLTEYIEYVRVTGDTEETRKDCERIARSNIGYATGYFSDNVIQRWMTALPEVSHPVFGYGFGRGADPTPEEAFEMGKKMGRNIKKHRGENR